MEVVRARDGHALAERVRVTLVQPCVVVPN